MSVSDTIQLLICIVAFGGIAWGLVAFYLRGNEAKEERIQKSEKSNVLKSIEVLSEVMKEFRITQKDFQKEVNELKMAFLEIKIKFEDFSKAMDRFYRDASINTGDGFKLDPRKVNKQK